jgi:D-arabinose 1-dehydrogenase-like Zn-dependent alcohol dehydrogenase
VGKVTRVGEHVKGFKTGDLAAIGCIAETLEMLDFCAEHNIVADIELINVQQVNEAFNRLEKGDVKCNCPGSQRPKCAEHSRKYL